MTGHNTHREGENAYQEITLGALWVPALTGLGHIRDPSVGSRAVQLSEGADPRARRAEDTRRRILSSPGLDQAQDIPWRLAAPPPGGRRHIWVKIPNAARTGQRWAGRGLRRDTQPGKKKPAQSLVGRAESGPGARVEAGPTPQRVGGGGPRRECRAVGDWAGLLRPRPRAGSQWARRRRVTEGAEVRVPRRRRRTAQPEREGLGGARGFQCSGGDPGARGCAARGCREERGRFGGGAMPLAQLKEPWPLMELVPLDPEVSERGGGRAPAAGQPGSAQGRGGPRRLCSPARTRVPSGL